MNAHYDLKKNIAKQEGVTQTPNILATSQSLTENSAVPSIDNVMSNEATIGFKEPNVTDDSTEIFLEPILDFAVSSADPVAEESFVQQTVSQKDAEMRADEAHTDDESLTESESDSQSMPHEIDAIKIRGGKTYINPRIFDQMDVIKSDKVPDDVDGICKYEIPIGDSLNNCKGCRPWGKIITSKSKEFQRVLDYYLRVEEVTYAEIPPCDNILDFVNRSDFTEQNGITICSICNVEAKCVACEARLYIEKNLKRKLIRSNIMGRIHVL